MTGSKPLRDDKPPPIKQKRSRLEPSSASEANNDHAGPVDETDSTIADHAATYAAYGLAVFRLAPGTKRPSAKGWQTEATTDPAAARELFPDGCRFGIGIACGAPSGNLVVIDVDDDERADGHATLVDLESALGPVGESVRTLTPGGGLHIFTEAPGDVCVSNASPWGAAGIDVRGTGGYVVAPPSRHPDGGDYCFEVGFGIDEIEIVELSPKWLKQLEQAGPKDPKTTGEVTAERAALREAAKAWDRAVGHGSNLETVELMIRYGWQLTVPRMTVEAVTDDSPVLLTRPGKEPREGASATVGYGGRAGMVHCFTSSVPGFQAEANYTPPLLRTMLSHDGDLAAADREAAERYGGERTHRDATDDNEWFATILGDQADDDDSPSPAPENPLLAKVLNTPGLKALPAPRFVIDGIVPEDSLIVLYGAPGVGKSFIAQSLMMSLRSGVPFLGFEVNHRRKGLYVVGESAAGFGPRIQAWETHHGESVDDLAWFPEALDLRSVSTIDHVADMMRQLDCGFVVFDTLSRCTPGLDENASDGMSQVVGNIDRLRTAVGGAIVGLVHHTGKDSGKGMRGHSALHGATDTEILISNSHVEIAKQKNAEEIDKFAFRMLEVGDSIVPVPVSRGPRERRDYKAMEGVSDALAELNAMNSRELRQKCHGFADSRIDLAARELEEAGYLRREKIGNATHHYLLKPYRAKRDPKSPMFDQEYANAYESD